MSLFDTSDKSPKQCLPRQLCLDVPSIAVSPSFLGQLLEPAQRYVWAFVQVQEPNSVIRILDFDVSCSSGKILNCLITFYHYLSNIYVSDSWVLLCTNTV